METDLSEMVKLMREVKFLRKLSSDGGDFSSLIRYSLEYRHKVDGSKFKDKQFEFEAEHRRQCLLAANLKGDTELEKTLQRDIAGGRADN